MSYFESYFNLRREKTLRRYSVPVDLSRFDGRGWMTAEDDLWDIPDYLANVRHFPLITPAQVRGLGTVDRRMFAAGPHRRGRDAPLSESYSARRASVGLIREAVRAGM